MTLLWCADFSPIRAISKAVLGLNIYLIAITEAAGSQSERDSLLCDLAWAFSAHGYILSACPIMSLSLVAFVARWSSVANFGVVDTWQP